jgi:LPS sulfotransferase NodH
LEYFHPKHLEKWKAKFGATEFEEVLSGLFMVRTSPSGWFGVKAHWSQFEPIAKNPAQLSSLGCSKYIRIFRNDTLAQAISLVIARKTSAWISFHQVRKQPKYDFQAIQIALAEIEAENGKWEAFFQERGVDPLIVEYENLCKKPADVVNNILSYFNLDAESNKVSPTPRPERQSTPLNFEWKQRYLEDVSIGSKRRRWL